MIAQNKGAKAQPAAGRWRVIATLMMLYDAAAIGASYYAALLLRYDMIFSRIPTSYLTAMGWLLPVYCAL